MRNTKFNTENFILRSKEIHFDTYSYELVIYKGCQEKVEIVCKKHGSFLQEPNVHLKGKGCPKCGREKTIYAKTLTFDEMLVKAKKSHGDKYDYTNSVYHGINKKMKITCKKHGDFEQTPANHIYNLNHCPKCDFTISKPEIELQEFVQSLNVKIESNKRNIITPYELDIYLPELNKAIEFNGMRWHYNKETCKKQKGYHGMKSNLCREKGIKLLHVREDLWRRDKKKMKKIIEKFIYDR